MSFANSSRAQSNLRADSGKQYIRASASCSIHIKLFDVVMDAKLVWSLICSLITLEIFYGKPINVMLFSNIIRYYYDCFKDSPNTMTNRKSNFLKMSINPKFIIPFPIINNSILPLESHNTRIIHIASATNPYGRIEYQYSFDMRAMDFEQIQCYVDGGFENLPFKTKFGKCSSFIEKMIQMSQNSANFNFGLLLAKMNLTAQVVEDISKSNSSALASIDNSSALTLFQKDASAPAMSSFIPAKTNPGGHWNLGFKKRY